MVGSKEPSPRGASPPAVPSGTSPDRSRPRHSWNIWRRQEAVRRASRHSGRPRRPSGGRDADLALDGAVATLRQRPGIGPVAHEGGVAGLEDAPGLFLRVVEDALGRDGADPAGSRLQGLGSLRVLDGDLALLVDDGAAAEGGHPFERIGGQALIGAALPDIAPEIAALPALRSPSWMMRAVSVSSAQVCGTGRGTSSSRSLR